MAILRYIGIGVLVLLGVLALNLWYNIVWMNGWVIIVPVWSVCPLLVHFFDKKFSFYIGLVSALISLSALCSYNSVLDFLGSLLFVGYWSEYDDNVEGVKEHMVLWYDHILFHLLRILYCVPTFGIPVLTFMNWSKMPGEQ